jgi:hypothetical protein
MLAHNRILLGLCAREGILNKKRLVNEHVYCLAIEKVEGNYGKLSRVAEEHKFGNN